MDMRSIATLDLQYAHRFYGFKGEAQYLHGHTGHLTIEVEDSVNMGVNMEGYVDTFCCLQSVNMVCMLTPCAKYVDTFNYLKIK